MAVIKNSKVPAGQVMDVAHPGKSTPSATAKPVIVTNRPLMADPMVKDEAAAPTAEESSTPTTAPPVTKRLVIKPLSEDEAVPTDIAPAKAPTSTEVTAAPAEDATSIAVTVKTATSETPESTGPTIAEAIAKASANQEPAAAKIPEANPTPDEPAPKPDTVSDTPQPDEVATEVEVEATPDSAEPIAPTTPKPADKPTEIAKAPDTSAASTEDKSTLKDIPKSEAEIAAAADVEDAHAAALEKLVETKQYFLPINTVEKRRTKRFVVVGVILVLLLAAAWADIALDAGLITIPNVKPVTHFFSN